MNLKNRRYIGSKAKLLDWIFEHIEKHTNGLSFFDVFAGTGCVSERAIELYENIYVNDILYSNNIIYKALWGKDTFEINKILNFINDIKNIDVTDLEDNYFSINYGNKYFGKNDSKKIGFIRDLLEEKK